MKFFSLSIAGALFMAYPLQAAGRSAPPQAPSRPVSRVEVVPPPEPLVLAFPGPREPAPYEKFGVFENEGTPQYRYQIKKRNELALAVGEGIYPNTSVFKDPAYKALVAQKKLEGSHWNYVDGIDARRNFFKWATAPEDPGVKQFYTAVMLERAGLIKEAVEGFYATAAYYPKTLSYTYFDTPWYVGPSSLDRLEQLLRRHPQLNIHWTPGRILVENKFDTTTANDRFLTSPGRLIKSKKGYQEAIVDVSRLKVVKTIGGPKIQLRQYENDQWQLFVDSRPFPIKAITYSVTPVGRSPDRGTWDVSKDWQLIDVNHSGQHDGFFESYVDKNRNDRQDPDEPTVGDVRLLKDLGANTLRAYHHLYDKELFRRVHRESGLYVLCGDVLGGYAVGSGAKWYDGTDYNNPVQRQTMLGGVRKMVEEYKDEPYILMWVLGNENVYGVANNSQKEPQAFFSLVNEAATLIHTLDPTRPVALANGDILFMDLIKTHAPEIDVLGMNVYRGEQGFGRTLFEDARRMLNKPVLITEFGAPAYAEGIDPKVAEAYQAMYLANNWEDATAHMAGRGVGNVLGGVLFEFVDEWWKANSDLPAKIQKQRADWYAKHSATYKNLQPENQDTVPQFGLPYIDGWSYEEWFGIVSQGSGKGSPFARVLRPAYYAIQALWTR